MHNEEMRRLAREAALLAGGGRAILLQVAHPAVAAGVAEHSDFTARPLDRLRTTLTYVYAMTYGTPDEVRAVSAAVTEIHRRVAGPGYRATDPELQRWVAATLYDTAVLIYRELFGDLEPDVAERTYRQYAVLGSALQVPERLWPEDRAAFSEYWAQMVATLEVGDQARAVARDLLHPAKAPLLIKVGMPLERFLTAAWLPERIRDGYGIAWDEGHQRRYDRLVRAGAPVYRRLPLLLREAPKNYYLRDMRRRLALRTAS